MEISSAEKLWALKDEGVSPLYSIWIVHEKQDDDTFDVNVWDEIENERDDNLERSRFSSFEDAEKALVQIVEENPETTFVRLLNVMN